jgi:hypothetical protein
MQSARVSAWRGYRQTQERLHTASDGQKFEVRGDSLHASRSFKYFSQGQGVSANTFVDERNFLWHSLMISAADRESQTLNRYLQIDGYRCNFTQTCVRRSRGMRPK